MGNFGVTVSLTSNHGRFRSTSGRIQGGPNMKITLSILSEEGTGRGVCILPILVEAGW